MTEAVYAPEVFEVSSLRAAKEIILTPEDFSSDERWRVETPYLAELIINNLKVVEEDLILDYGCGVGRIAKELIKQIGCRVVGVDSSASMRALAASYVESPKFFSCAPEALPLLPKFRKVFAVWVFQHIPNLSETLKGLSETMACGARLAIANNHQRVLPTNRGWINDGVNVSNELNRFFSAETTEVKLDPEFVGRGVSQNTYWKLFRKPFLGD